MKKGCIIMTDGGHLSALPIIIVADRGRVAELAWRRKKSAIEIDSSIWREEIGKGRNRQ
jgi:hypothetical protein